MGKYRLKKQIRLKPEIKEKLDEKKEKAFSKENLAKAGSIVTIGSGLAGLALKAIKIRKEIKS